MTRRHYFHVWFSTKGRKMVLEGEIEDEVRRLLRESAERNQIELLELELMFDHVHLLLGLPGPWALPLAMQRLKGRTAYELFKLIPLLKLDMHSHSLWQKGYGWREVLPANLATVRRYIRTQKERSHRHAF